MIPSAGQLLLLDYFLKVTRAARQCDHAETAAILLKWQQVE